jgi:hypothetical protein
MYLGPTADNREKMVGAESVKELMVTCHQEIAQSI